MDAFRRMVVAAMVAGSWWAAAVAADPAPLDAAAAKAEFEAAAKAMKDLFAELTVLQAQFHQPKADKAAIEASFKETAQKAEAASDRLETAALALAVADPGNTEARQISGSAVAAAVRADAPELALEKATKLAAAGVADADTFAAAASAALVLSELDDAAAWAAKAKAAGARRDRLAELEEAIEHDREKVAAEMEVRRAEAAADDLPRVKVSTSVGDVVVELFENEAPNTVANFLNLVEKGFYAGTPFHRVIPEFMAQGGDPTGRGSGGPGYAIKCETDKPNARKHFRGSLSMAHAGKDTGGSQFFLTFRPTEHLDGKHTVFGRVIEGFDVLSLIRRTQSPDGRPIPGIKPDTILEAEVVRKRPHDYAPETIPEVKK